MQTIAESASQSLQSQLAFMAKQIETLTALAQQTVAKPSRKGDNITFDWTKVRRPYRSLVNRSAPTA